MEIPKTMQAAGLVGRRRIGLFSLPVERPGRGEVLIRVRAVGLCRSDLHYYLYGRIGSQIVRKYPQPLGHEPAGDIVAVGRGVRHVKPGDRVAVEPAAPCGKCADCRRGAGNVCAKVYFLGMPGLKGAFAEYLVYPAHNVVKVPKNTPYDQAAALEPLTIGCHSVGLLGKRKIKSALVVGAGPIGLSVLAILKHKKVPTTVVDYVPARLKVAKRMGAKKVMRVIESRPMAWSAKRLGRQFDAVFEAGGTEEAVNLSLEAAAPSGTVALIGIPDGDTINVNPHSARRKELTVMNVRRSNGELPECARLLAGKRVNLKPMLTHHGGLKDAARLFEVVANRRGGAVKATILP